jgi:hypothetical protein
LFKLKCKIGEYDPPGKLLEEEPHEKCKAATYRTYELPNGIVVFTEWKKCLHEVIYQTPMANPRARDRRNKMLFEFYGEGFGWKEVLDNGFGKTYRRVDMKRYALWSYTMDYNTFGTMEFHKHKW